MYCQFRALISAGERGFLRAWIFILRLGFCLGGLRRGWLEVEGGGGKLGLGDWVEVVVEGRVAGSLVLYV